VFIFNEHESDQFEQYTEWDPGDPAPEGSGSESNIKELLTKHLGYPVDDNLNGSTAEILT